MIVGILSRRCFHCVEIDDFAGPHHVNEHIDALIGTPCPLCGTKVQKGDVDLAIDSAAPELIKQNRAVWNPGDERPANFSAFFTRANRGKFGDIASRLASRVDAAARARRRSRCEAGTAALIPVVMSQGQQAMTEGRTDVATRAFQVCGEHGDEPQVCLASFHLGEIEQQRNNLKAAVRHFEKAAQATETALRASALLYQALALHELGDREGALRGYRRCVECGESPVLGMAAHRLGLLLEFLGDKPEARQAYEIVVRRRDGHDSTRAALNLAMLEEADGRWAEAKKLWQYAFTSSEDETRTVASFNLGRAAEIDGDLRKARKFYQIAARSSHQEAAQRARKGLADLG